MRALVFNCGSSSLKFELAELDPSLHERVRAARGGVEKIGGRADYHMIDFDGRRTSGATTVLDHQGAAGLLLDWLEKLDGGLNQPLAAVAHRVVHGGEDIREARVVDSEVLAALERASAFAPLHNPSAIGVLRLVSAKLPSIPAVVLPDTAFHHTLSSAARTYALPDQLARRHGIRRFGFHGIGHAWMLSRYAELVRRPASSLNLVTFHLGAGCSACAIRQGVSIDTSMGLTPLEGLVMATRSGDLDPSIVGYLAEHERLTPADLDRMLNHESGLAGISGLSGDMRELRAAADQGGERARLALEVFVHRIRKYLGAYMVMAGPVDAVLFGGGIGEHDHLLRQTVLSDLGWLGLEIDQTQNIAANGRELCVSTPESAVTVWVIPLDEELYIARAALRLIGRLSESSR